MNATIIDIPGIHVNITPITGEHTTDVSSVIEIKDEKGNYVTVSVCYGKIVKIESKLK